MLGTNADRCDGGSIARHRESSFCPLVSSSTVERTRRSRDASRVEAFGAAFPSAYERRKWLKRHHMPAIGREHKQIYMTNAVQKTQLHAAIVYIYIYTYRFQCYYRILPTETRLLYHSTNPLAVFMGSTLQTLFARLLYCPAQVEDPGKIRPARVLWIVGGPGKRPDPQSHPPNALRRPPSSQGECLGGATDG